MRRKRTAQVRNTGRSWRKAALKTGPLPSLLRKWWEIVTAHGGTNLAEVGRFPACTLALLNLLAAADEASARLGLFFSHTHSADPYENEAERLLFTSTNSLEGSTLCTLIPATKGRVLPKMHTPQSGLTIRSLSHNLAYTYSPDVHPEWLSAAVDNKHHCFNLLAIPWPMHVDPQQFRASRSVGIADVLLPNAYGLFTYKASRGPSIEFVRALIEKAEAKIGRVDGIVFPELSMSKQEFDHLAEEFVNQDRFLVAGVGSMAKSSTDCGSNHALLSVGITLPKAQTVRATFTQKKHHRWKLNKSQIVQYALASNLHPGADWWEHIAVGERTLSFVTFRPWLTMSVLICEDLARPDPVGDVLRAVGPNLMSLCFATRLNS